MTHSSSQGGVASAKADNDGDIGLQGMIDSEPQSMAASPELEGQSAMPGQRPASGIRRLLESMVLGQSASSDGKASATADGPAANARKMSSSSIVSTQSFQSVNGMEEIRQSTAPVGRSPDAGAAPTSPLATSSSTSADTSQSPTSVELKKTRSNQSKQKRADRRLIRMREEIAGPAAERPLAGSSNGPSLTPRRTSVARSSTGTSEEKANITKTSPARKRPGTGDASLHDAKGSSVQDEDASAAAGVGLGVSLSSAAQKLKTVFLSGAEETAQEANPPKTDAAPEEASTGPEETAALNGAKMPSTPRSDPKNGLRREDAAKEGNSTELQDAVGGSAVGTESLPLASPPAEDSLNEAALQRWVLSVGCVNFDLEKGPDLEFLYPKLGISREERDCIAFSSFPDTSIFDDGHAVFSWRVREVPLDSSSSEAPLIASPLGIGRTDSSKGSTPSSTLRSRRSVMGSPLRRLAGFEKFRAFTSGENKEADVMSPEIEVFPGSDGYTALEASQSESTDAKDERISASSSDSIHADGAAVNTPRRENSGSISEDLPYLSLAPRTTGSTHSSSIDYIHGFCYFRQKRDASIRRGYFQKSLVILSHLPYVSFFGEIVRRLGPLFFEKGMPVLESFAQDVQSWPPPEPGARLHLPLLGSVISVELPFHSQAQTSPMTELKLSVPGNGAMQKDAMRNTMRRGDGTKEDEPILASIPVTPIFEVFKEALEDMWLLWECLILAEPILVVGPDPTTCSEAVWHMLDLIKPIPFAGDFRPYFTIHDHDFKALVTKNKPGAGIIIGVTNPFMLQACKHWPHILKVGKAAVKAGVYSKSTGKKIHVGSEPGKGVGGIAGGNSAGGGGPMHTPGLVSKGKRRISKDRTLLKTLSEIAEKKSNEQSANDALRLYFTDLTERFLAPLNRYVSSLIPADFSLASPSEAPKIKPFNTTAFLSSLKAHGTPLPVRSRNLPTGSAVRQSLYLDFIQCPNFGTWLQARIHQSQEEQYMRKLAALESGDIPQYVKSRGELETIDLYSRLKLEIEGINHKLSIGRKERELQPNSRWRPDQGSTESSLTPLDDRRSFKSEPQTSTGVANCPPLESLVRLPANAPAAQSIRNVINAPSWQRSFTSGERILLNKKARLIDQLDRLMNALPADLQQTLQLKERQRRLELRQKQSRNLMASPVP